jgi:hypothetical protein
MEKSSRLPSKHTERSFLDRENSKVGASEPLSA